MAWQVVTIISTFRLKSWLFIPHWLAAASAAAAVVTVVALDIALCTLVLS